MISYEDIKDSPHLVVVETPEGIRLFEFEGENAMADAADFVNQFIGKNGFSGRLITAVRYRQTGNYDYAKLTNTGICR